MAGWSAFDVATARDDEPADHEDERLAHGAPRTASPAPGAGLVRLRLFDVKLRKPTCANRATFVSGIVSGWRIARARTFSS